MSWTKRGIAIGGVVAMGWAFAPGLSAQDNSEWNDSRADAAPPVGVEGYRVVTPEEFLINYRFRSLYFEGSRVGSGDVIANDVLIDEFGFELVEVDRQIRVHEFDFAVGISDRFTLRFVAPLLDLNMNQLRSDGETFVRETRGFGDARVETLWPIYESSGVRAHINAGISVPTGSVSEAENTTVLVPGTAPDLLSFAMQLGSGTFDVIPGATIVAMNDHGSVGAQVKGTFRTGTNDQDYRLGHRFMGTVWLQPALTDNFAVSARVLVQSWGNVDVEGQVSDADIIDQPRNPFLQGGTRWDLPLGVNFLFPGGALDGHRLGAEVVIPIYRDLDGPQVDLDWGFTLSWRKIFL